MEDDHSHLYGLMRPPKACLCRNVTCADIDRAVMEQNAQSLKDIIKITRATTGCGSCVIDVKAALQKALDKKNSPLFHQTNKAQTQSPISTGHPNQQQ